VVVVERGAGSAASFEDSGYEEAGAQLADSAWDADVVVKVQKPTADEASRLREGAVLVGFLEPLTDQERVVLGFLPTLMSNQEIAGELFVSINTVKTHLKSIYRKLGVSRRSDAVRAARELRLVG